MTEPTRMYRAQLSARADAEHGCHFIAWHGHVTPCGQWVEQAGGGRWPLDGTWYATEAKAVASLADQIEAVALACNRQARRLKLGGEP